MKPRSAAMALYLLFMIVPVYWLVNMSLKTNTEITTTLTLWPRNLTFDNYIKIFTDQSWYSGYIHSITYVIINTVLSVAVALPAAYARSSKGGTNGKSAFTHAAADIGQHGRAAPRDWDGIRRDGRG